MQNDYNGYNYDKFFSYNLFFFHEGRFLFS